MSVSAISSASQDVLFEEIDRQIKCYTSSGKKVLLICPSMGWVSERKESIALTIPFGVDVLTFSQFVQQRWELEGDGRALIHNCARQMLVSELIAQWNMSPNRTMESALVGSYDFADHIARFIKNGSGSTAFEQFPSVPTGLILSQREEAIIELAALYSEEISERNLVEENEALSIIDCAEAQNIILIFEGFFAMTRQQLDFIERASVKRETLVACQYRDNDTRFSATRDLYESIVSIPGATHKELEMFPNTTSELDRFKKALYTLEILPGTEGKVCFAEAQGAHAENALIANVLESEVSAGIDPGAIVVWMKDTGSCASGLADELELRGIPAVIESSSKIGVTHIGVAIISLFELITQKSFTAASSFITSPFSGLSQRRGWDYNKKWRETRATDGKDFFEDIIANETTESPVVTILHLAKSVVSAGKEWRSPFKQLVESMCRVGESQRNILPTLDIKQAWVINDALCRMADQGEPVGSDFDLEIVKHLSVSYEIATAHHSDGGSVRVISPLSAAPKKYEVVVIANLNSAEYPMDQDRSPLDVLLENLGVISPVDLADVQRWNFFQAIQNSKERVIFERALFDTEAKETIASALYEAALDVFKDSSTSEMKINLIEESEGNLAETIPSQSETKRVLRKQVAVPGSPKYVSTVKRGQLKAVDDVLDGLTSFSPTEIEAYIECPYKWFYEKKIKPKSIDKEFGVQEMGEFLHGILALFYHRFTTDKNGEYIQKRLTSNDLDAAITLFDRCIEDYRRDQGDLIVTNEFEDSELEWKIRSLRNFIKSDVDFLPSYYPKEFEYAFGRGDRTVDYAGVRLHGSVDRIDVHSDTTRLVVVDYKSGSLDDYILPRCNTKNNVQSIYNGKVQAPIYASAISRLFEIPAVGSVYRSISKRDIAGSWSLSGLGIIDFEGLPANGKVPRDIGVGIVLPGEPENYQAYLDGVEEYVAVKLERLKEGIIIPEPCSDKACKYCGARSICGEAR